MEHREEMEDLLYGVLDTVGPSGVTLGSVDPSGRFTIRPNPRPEGRFPRRELFERYIDTLAGPLVNMAVEAERIQERFQKSTEKPLGDLGTILEDTEPFQAGVRPHGRRDPAIRALATPGGMLNPHVRDNGGPLLPGFTFNGTGRNETVVRGGRTVTVEKGAVQVNIRGDADGSTARKLRQAGDEIAGKMARDLARALEAGSA